MDRFMGNSIVFESMFEDKEVNEMEIENGRYWFESNLNGIGNKKVIDRLRKNEKLKEYGVIGDCEEGYVICEVQRNEQVNDLFHLWVNSLRYDKEIDELMKEREGEKLYLCLRIVERVEVVLRIESEIMIFEKE
jgi:hypothetical protein